MTLRITCAAVLMVLTACSPATSVCETAARCDDGADNVEGCAAAWEANVRVLRENDEAECHALADARWRYDDCRKSLGCDDFAASDHNGQCNEEQDAYVDAVKDAGTSCSAAD